jgi:hypothetical protein
MVSNRRWESASISGIAGDSTWDAGRCKHYRVLVYRALVMFPKSASPVEVDALIEGIASSFSASAGFQAMTRSAGALMGPGAKAGQVGWILEADFASLDDVMAALHAEGFLDVKAATESVGTTIFLFEFTTV